MASVDLAVSMSGTVEASQEVPGSFGATIVEKAEPSSSEAHLDGDSTAVVDESCRAKSKAKKQAPAESEASAMTEKRRRKAASTEPVVEGTAQQPVDKRRRKMAEGDAHDGHKAADGETPGPVKGSRRRKVSEEVEKMTGGETQPHLCHDAEGSVAAPGEMQPQAGQLYEAAPGAASAEEPKVEGGGVAAAGELQPKLRRSRKAAEGSAGAGQETQCSRRKAGAAATGEAAEATGEAAEATGGMQPASRRRRAAPEAVEATSEAMLPQVAGGEKKQPKARATAKFEGDAPIDGAATTAAGEAQPKPRRSRKAAEATEVEVQLKPRRSRKATPEATEVEVQPKPRRSRKAAPEATEVEVQPKPRRSRKAAPEATEVEAQPKVGGRRKAAPEADAMSTDVMQPKAGRREKAATEDAGPLAATETQPKAKRQRKTEPVPADGECLPRTDRSRKGAVVGSEARPSAGDDMPPKVAGRRKKASEDTIIGDAVEAQLDCCHHAALEVQGASEVEVRSRALKRRQSFYGDPDLAGSGVAEPMIAETASSPALQ